MASLLRCANDLWRGPSLTLSLMIIRDTALHPKITSDHRPCQGLAAANYRVLCVLDSGFDQRRPGRVHQLGADASRWCTLAAGRARAMTPGWVRTDAVHRIGRVSSARRSEEHTSELQSRVE